MFAPSHTVRLDARRTFLVLLGAVLASVCLLALETHAVDPPATGDWVVDDDTALSDQDMLDLAAYYASQPRKPLTADPDLVAEGERLYRGGNQARGISACAACHGPRGLGNPGAAYPAVAGQHATYTANSLRAYASKERKSDPNQMMRNISGLLTEDDIAAVSSYIQGLQ